MAKEHRRGNREIRKPKANKPPAASATSSLSTKGTLVLADSPKKKS